MPSTAMNLRQLPLAFALLAAVAALPVQACEFDGLSHGYGPNEALFAGAHRYQALNGFADDAEARAGVAAPPEAVTMAKPPPPPRSFAHWAARKTRGGAADEVPAPGGRALSPPRHPSAKTETGRASPASQRGRGASRGG